MRSFNGTNRGYLAGKRIYGSECVYNTLSFALRPCPIATFLERFPIIHNVMWGSLFGGAGGRKSRRTKRFVESKNCKLPIQYVHAIELFVLQIRPCGLMARRLTSNQKILGSTPSGVIHFIKCYEDIQIFVFSFSS